MNQPIIWDLVYLNKHDSDLDNDWVYYRVRSRRGDDLDPISVCQVSWPKFEDIDLIWDERKAVITTPGLTGMASAYEQIHQLIQNRWGIDHTRSIVIGSLIREP